MRHRQASVPDSGSAVIRVEPRESLGVYKLSLHERRQADRVRSLGRLHSDKVFHADFESGLAPRADGLARADRRGYRPAVRKADTGNKPTVLMYVSFADTDEVRGGPRSILLTATYLKRYSPRFIVTRENQYARDVRAAGFPVEVIETPQLLSGIRATSTIERTRRLGRIAQHDLAVARLVRKHQAVAIHCQMPSEALTLAPAARLSNVPLILHQRDERLGKGSDPLFHAAAAAASHIIYIAEPLKQYFEARAPALLRSWLQQRGTAIPNGLELDKLATLKAQADRLRAREHWNLPQDAVVITVAGPLTDKKNQIPYLRDAAPGLLDLDPRVHLVFAGSERADAEYASRCHDTTSRELDGARVHFLGELAHTQMWDLYAATDVVAIPSRYEGLPRVSLEAQGLGIPLIASDNAGNVGAIVDGETGYLVPVEELSAMVPHARSLLDPEARAAMGAAGRAHAERTFEIQAVTDRVEQIYDRVTHREMRADTMSAR